MAIRVRHLEYPLFLGLVVALFSLCLTPLHAQGTELLVDSFESPVLAEGSNSPNGSIPGWQVTGIGAVFNPMPSHVPNVPDGNQVAYLNAASMKRSLGIPLAEMKAYVSNNPVFRVRQTSFHLESDEQVALEVSFSPTHAVHESGTLTIESNDPDEGEITVFLQGRGKQQPPAQPVIRLSVVSPQMPGSTFEVPVVVEDVNDLFGVSFVLRYDPQVLEATQAVPGDLLGNDVVFYPNIDKAQGSVAIGITRKAPAQGVDGSGTMVHVTFQASASVPQETTVSLSIEDVKANDASGAPLTLTPQPAQLTLGVLLGDVSGNGTITAFDAYLVLRVVAGIASLTEEQQRRADSNQDGSITTQDAVGILRKVVGLVP